MKSKRSKEKKREEAQTLEQSIWISNLEQNNEKCLGWKCGVLLFEITLKTERVLVASFCFVDFLAVIDVGSVYSVYLCFGLRNVTFLSIKE